MWWKAMLVSKQTRYFLRIAWTLWQPWLELILGFFLKILLFKFLMHTKILFNVYIQLNALSYHHMMVWFNNKDLVVWLRWLVVQFIFVAFVKKLTCVTRTYYIKL